VIEFFEEGLTLQREESPSKTLLAVFWDAQTRLLGCAGLSNSIGSSNGEFTRYMGCLLSCSDIRYSKPQKDRKVENLENVEETSSIHIYTILKNPGNTFYLLVGFVR